MTPSFEWPDEIEHEEQEAAPLFDDELPPDHRSGYVAVIGRPNVGKSTLFNYLTRTRDALVADVPGLTRDRQYGRGEVGDRPYLVVDTGGLTEGGDVMETLIASQVEQALEEADGVLFLVDGRAGLNASDEAIAERLRRYQKPILLAVNKTERLEPDMVVSEFHSLGLGQPYPISSAHGQGVHGLVEALSEGLEQPAEAPPVKDSYQP